MRQIKFRAFDPKRNRMVYSFDDDYEFNIYLDGSFSATRRGYVDGVGERSICIDSDDDAVIMQFTGLLDKNGKEIYEGDILKYHYNMIVDSYNEYIDADETNIGSVVYSGCCFCIEGEDEAPTLKNWCIDWLEVIGNEFENPDLIK